MKGRNITRGKVFTPGTRLPFQYTPEGRAQIAANLKRYKVPMLPSEWLAKPPPIDLSQVEATLALPPGLNQLATLPAEAVMRADIERARELVNFYPMKNLVRDPDVQPVRDERRCVRSHASYLTQLFEDADACIQKFRVRMRAVDFDTLVGTGISGTLAAQLFARALGIGFAIVRKEADGTHSSNQIEGNVGKRWVFVDDLIASGATRRRVLDAMKIFCDVENWKSTYVGDYLYYTNTFHPKEIDGNVKEST